ncbi:hypothetical protein THICB3320755 [Thiomonas sp. CB3]|nr:hypothetical protein THICB3320755 [Thiomonas sp. CB3]
MLTSLYARLGAGIAVLLLGFGLGWTIQGWRLSSQLEHATAALSQQVAIVAQARSDAEAQARQRLQAAQAAADAAVSTAQERAATAQRKTQELQHDLSRATVGRPCLSSAAVGLLNSLPAIGHPGAGLHLPTTAAGPAAAPAAAASAAADRAGRTSTDADIAGWIAAAAGQYETCRARIDALRDWAQSLPDAPQSAR